MLTPSYYYYWDVPETGCSGFHEIGNFYNDIPKSKKRKRFVKYNNIILIVYLYVSNIIKLQYNRV